MEPRPQGSPLLRTPFDEVWQENEAGLRYLADDDPGPAHS
jgi:hypothetical protein